MTKRITDYTRAASVFGSFHVFGRTDDNPQYRYLTTVKREADFIRTSFNVHDWGVFTNAGMLYRGHPQPKDWVI